MAVSDCNKAWPFVPGVEKIESYNTVSVKDGRLHFTTDILLTHYFTLTRIDGTLFLHILQDFKKTLRKKNIFQTFLIFDKYFSGVSLSITLLGDSEENEVVFIEPHCRFCVLP